MNVEVLAILNDTTGTLACGSFEEHECAAAMIIGTGSNACYLESVERVPKWREPRAPSLIVPNGSSNSNANANGNGNAELNGHAGARELEALAMRRAFYDRERQVYVSALFSSPLPLRLHPPVAAALAPIECSSR